jgi:hypothetical protein
MRQFFHYLYIAIWDFGKYVWPAVGPLVGVLIGAWLSRSWDKSKWERDNRKEECRELIKSISHAATEILDRGSGGTGKAAHEAYLDSLKTFHDRIFIADDVEKQNVYQEWVKAVLDLDMHNIDRQAFSDQVEVIREKIIKIALGKSA